MPTFVGVDAGGTSIECVVEQDGEVRTARGEAANVRTAGVARAAERIAATVRSALRGDVFDALAAGAAGAGDFVLARALEVALRAYFPGAAVAVFDDAEIALRAAIPQGDGAVLIAGTGSIAYARVGEKVHRAGGYGYLIGDDGSGFAIGRAALAQLLRWYDGRAAHSELFDAMRAQLGVHDAQELLRCVYGEPHPVAIVASIAPLDSGPRRFRGPAGEQNRPTGCAGTRGVAQGARPPGEDRGARNPASLRRRTLCAKLTALVSGRNPFARRPSIITSDQIATTSSSRGARAGAQDEA